MMDTEQLKKIYNQREEIIKKRLEDFSKVKGGDIFYELCFCLLTPQSNAFKCDEAVKGLKKLDFYNKNIKIEKIENILKRRTRFYRNKSKYLSSIKNQYKKINQLKNNKKNKNKLREYLIENVKGLGYKEASHFLRNIGYRDLAILDRHILKNLKSLGVIKKIPALNKKNYLKIEKKFYKFSKKIKIPMDELDLLFWSIETGKVFK